MRILGARVGHRILGHLARLGIEPADQRRRVAGVPDVPGHVGDQAVRPGARRLQFELGHLAGRGIEPRQLVHPLLGEPERSVGCLGRIVRVRAGAGRVELLDGDLQLGRGRRRRGNGEHQYDDRLAMCDACHLSRKPKAESPKPKA